MHNSVPTERQEFNASQIKQLIDGAENLEKAFARAQSSVGVDDQTPLSIDESEELLRQTSRMLSNTSGASAVEFEELQASGHLSRGIPLTAPPSES